MTFLILINLALILLVLYIEIPKIRKTPENTPKMTKEEKKRMEEAKKSFENLMNYDEKQAMRKE